MRWVRTDYQGMTALGVAGAVFGVTVGDPWTDLPHPHTLNMTVGVLASGTGATIATAPASLSGATMLVTHNEITGDEIRAVFVAPGDVQLGGRAPAPMLAERRWSPRAISAQVATRTPVRTEHATYWSGSFGI